MKSKLKVSPHTDLQRFLKMPDFIHYGALAEIRKGKKESDWMWFAFPQMNGLGDGVMAVRYGIHSLEEAVEYVKNPKLGGRLKKITEEILKIKSNDAEEVFGYPDNLKLRSSMTLFKYAEPRCKLFQRVLDKFFHGSECSETLNILREQKN